LTACASSGSESQASGPCVEGVTDEPVWQQSAQTAVSTLRASDVFVIAGAARPESLAAHFD